MTDNASGIDVVHVIGALVAGGAERFVVDLLIAMRGQGIDVGLIVLSNRFDSASSQMRERLETAAIPVRIGPTQRVRFATVRWYRRILRDMSPKLLHMHTSNTVLIHEFAGRAHAVNPTLVRTVHNTELPNSWIKIRALKRSQASLISCSATAADAYLEKLGKPSTVIPNGIQFDWPVRDAGNSKTMKQKLGLDGNSFHVVSVGRMEGAESRMQKAQDTLIRAWQLAEMSRMDGFLHFLGDGSARPGLEAMASGNSSIRFHGIVPNVRDWLIAADCFAMPSRWEGLPIAGLEAVGTGVPLLFSDIGPLRELNAPAASWVPADNVAELADALKTLRTHPQTPDSKEVLGWRAQHDIATTARQYIEAYARLNQR